MGIMIVQEVFHLEHVFPSCVLVIYSQKGSIRHVITSDYSIYDVYIFRAT
jgi:hypothetical protein